MYKVPESHYGLCAQISTSVSRWNGSASVVSNKRHEEAAKSCRFKEKCIVVCYFRWKYLFI